MRTTLGFTRLVAFSDGVVAIAITLLILPLVDTVTQAGGDVGRFMNEHSPQLFAFLLSFVVIGNFWITHHQMYERARGYTRGLLWLNLLWLMSIVFLPFPRALLASGNSPATHLLYIGTMLVTTGAGFAQELVLVRHPELQAEGAQGTVELLPYASTVVILALALIVAVTLPAIGLWSLLLLLVATPAEKLIRRQRGKVRA